MTHTTDPSPSHSTTTPPPVSHCTGDAARRPHLSTAFPITQQSRNSDFSTTPRLPLFPSSTRLSYSEPTPLPCLSLYEPTAAAVPITAPRASHPPSKSRAFALIPAKRRRSGGDDTLYRDSHTPARRASRRASPPPYSPPPLASSLATALPCFQPAAPALAAIRRT